MRPKTKHQRNALEQRLQRDHERRRLKRQVVALEEKRNILDQHAQAMRSNADAATLKLNQAKEAPAD